MGKISKVFVPLIAVTSIILSIYCLYLEDLRKVRIDQAIELLNEINNRPDTNSTNTDSLRNEIIQLQFERQSYTANIDLMSNWFILFETILFGIFFIVGYGVFDNKIAESYKKNEASYENINERYVQIERDFVNVRKDSINALYNIYSLLAITSISNNIDFFRWSIVAANEAKLLHELEKSSTSLKLIEKSIINAQTRMPLDVNMVKSMKIDVKHIRDIIKEISVINEVNGRCAILLVEMDRILTEIRKES